MNSKDWLIGCGVIPQNDLVSALDAALRLQKQWCIDSIVKEMHSLGIASADIVDISKACDNANGGEV